LSFAFAAFCGQDGVEHASIGNASQSILEGKRFEFFLQIDQFGFGFFALADVEHESDQCFNFVILVADDMYDIAYPHIITVFAERTIVSFVICAGLGLRHAKIDYPFAIFRMHLFGPVLRTDPTFWRPAQQGFNLRADKGEGHAFPVYLSLSRLG
jgi:hypothetical protein